MVRTDLAADHFAQGLHRKVQIGILRELPRHHWRAVADESGAPGRHARERVAARGHQRIERQYRVGIADVDASGGKRFLVARKMHMRSHAAVLLRHPRSEERRVGKGWRSW